MHENDSLRNTLLSFTLLGLAVAPGCGSTPAQELVRSTAEAARATTSSETVVPDLEVDTAALANQAVANDIAVMNIVEDPTGGDRKCIEATSLNIQTAQLGSIMMTELGNGYFPDSEVYFYQNGENTLVVDPKNFTQESILGFSPPVIACTDPS